MFSRGGGDRAGGNGNLWGSAKAGMLTKHLQWSSILLQME